MARGERKPRRQSHCTTLTRTKQLGIHDFSADANLMLKTRQPPALTWTSRRLLPTENRYERAANWSPSRASQGVTAILRWANHADARTVDRQPGLVHVDADVEFRERGAKMGTPELGKTPALGFSTAILIALGWAVGWTINWLIFSAAEVVDNLSVTGSTTIGAADIAAIVILEVIFGGLLAWLVSGFICGTILRKRSVLSKGKSVARTAFGWAIGWLIGAAIVVALTFFGPFHGNGVDPGLGTFMLACSGSIGFALGGGVAGFLTANVIRTELGHFPWRRIQALIVGWSVSSLVGGATGLAVGGLLSLSTTWLAQAEQAIAAHDYCVDTGNGQVFAGCHVSGADPWQILLNIAITMVVGAVIIALFSLIGASVTIAEVKKEMELGKLQGEPLSQTDNAVA